ncbi:MAG: FecR domain-containing protein, partial [Desulfamplus sp.]|nr:FecR domain-containing protein [Desulfamplus sp.]
IFSFYLFVCADYAPAEETAAGKLVFSNGTVLFSLDKGASWSPVEPLMEFPEGAYIKTGDDGEVALMLNDRSQIRLAAKSLLHLKSTGSAPGEAVNKPGALDVISGKMWFRNKRKGSKPVFGTPVVSAAIRGTEMALSVSEDGATDITVLEGIVRCVNLQGEAIISRGEVATAKKDLAPVITKLLKPEKSVQWLLLTPDIIGPSDAEFIKNFDISNKSSVELNGIKVAQKAMELLVQGEDGALETAQNGVFLAPNRASTHVALATVLQSRGRFEEGLKEAEIAQNLDPLSVPALIRAVELLLGLDRVSQAQNRIAIFNGADIRVDMLNGYIALIKLDSTAAEIHFRKAIEQKRDLAPAYLGLGLSLYHQKQTAQGLENMEKASLLEPLAAYPHNYLAKAQYELGERYEAEVELNRAATLDPYDPTPYIYLATIFADNYRPGEGIRALEKSIALNDNKLATRSRYLLDQDRSSKNISLAWSLTTMGLYEWADSKGDLAVWDDESNSSAYLFRAAKAQIMGQVDADTIGDMKRAELLKPINANTYTSYNDYQNLLEMPEIKGSVTLNGGTDKTGVGVVSLNGANRATAFKGLASYNTTDGPFDGTGNSSSEGSISVKQSITSTHEILAQIRTIKGDLEDSSPWQDSRIEPTDINIDHELLEGSIGYHWHQGAGRDLMALVQAQAKESDSDTFIRKYMSSIDITQVNQKTLINDSDTLRAEMVQLFRVNSDSFGDHKISFGLSHSAKEASSERVAKLYYEPHSPFFQSDSRGYTSDEPDKKEKRLFFRDIWSISDSFNVDYGMAWCELENITLNLDNIILNNEFETTDKWLPHLGFMWKMSPLDTIKVGYFKESEPNVLSGTLQPVETAGFSRVFGSPQGTFTEFYGAGWDRQFSEKLFTRAEIYHKKRQFAENFTSHVDIPASDEEKNNLLWYDESQDIARLTFEYLMTDRFALSMTYQFTDHNTESGVDRNRVDNDLGVNFTWVHPSGVRLQNSWWFMSQKEKSGYLNPVDEDFIIASISAEKSLFDKRLLLVAKWENIFDEKYTYFVSDTTESSQLPWQGSFASVGLQWNF